MTTFRTIFGILALGAVLGLAACEEANDGPFEQLGEAADEAANDAKRAAEEAAGDLRRAAEDARD